MRLQLLSIRNGTKIFVRSKFESLAWSLELNQNGQLSKSATWSPSSCVPLLAFSILVHAIEKFTFSNATIFVGRALSEPRIPAYPHLLDVLEVKFENVFDEALTSEIVLLKLMILGPAFLVFEKDVILDAKLDLGSSV